MSSTQERTVSWIGRRVAITGAGGFLGSHLCERLVRAGAEVRALVHYNSRGSCGALDHAPLARDMEIVPGDVRNAEQMDRFVQGTEFVFHLAALTTVPWSYEVPGSFVQVNVEGTLNLLEASRKAGIARFVQASSSQCYGTARQVPITEDHPLQAQSPYSATKIAGDKLVEAWHRTFGLPTITLRVFCTYGPRQSVRNIVPTIITQLMRGPKIHLGNLHPSRDYNYVEDTIEAYVLGAQAEGVDGATMNVAGSSEIRIGALAELIARLMGTDIEIELDPRRARPPGSEVERLLGDSSQALTRLGWRHQVELEEGLLRTIAWYRAHADLVTPLVGSFV